MSIPDPDLATQFQVAAGQVRRDSSGALRQALLALRLADELVAAARRQIHELVRQDKP